MSKIGTDSTKFGEIRAKYNPVWNYPKNEINTPAATAEPITPEMLLAMQY